MKIEQGKCPHPVLNSNDLDVQGVFENLVERSTNAERDKFIITNNISLTNETLENCLKKGSVVRVLHVECGQTRYRRCVALEKDHESIEIPAGDIDGRVELNTLLVAAEDLPSYRNSEAHPEYGHQSFEVRKGEMLAVAPRVHFNADKDEDAFRNPNALFEIRKNSDKKKPPPMEVDLGQPNKVFIYLPREDYQICSDLLRLGRLDTKSGEMKFGANHVIFQAVVMPAVMEIFSKLHGGVDDLLLLPWFLALEQALKKSGYTIDYENGSFEPEASDVVVAQTLFKDFLSKALLGLQGYASKKDKEEENDDDD